MRYSLKKLTVVVRPQGVTINGKLDSLKHFSNTSLPFSLTEILPDSSGRNIMSITTVYWDGKIKRMTSVGNIDRINNSLNGEGKLVDRVESCVMKMKTTDKKTLLKQWNNLDSSYSKARSKSHNIDTRVFEIIVSTVCCCSGYLFYIARPSNDIGNPFYSVDLNISIDSEKTSICQELFTLIGSFWCPILELYISIYPNNGDNTNVGIVWLKMFAIICKTFKPHLIRSPNEDWTYAKDDVCKIICQWGAYITGYVDRYIEPYIIKHDDTTKQPIEQSIEYDDTTKQPIEQSIEQSIEYDDTTKQPIEQSIEQSIEYDDTTKQPIEQSIEYDDEQSIEHDDNTEQSIEYDDKYDDSD